MLSCGRRLVVSFGAFAFAAKQQTQQTIVF